VYCIFLQYSLADANQCDKLDFKREQLCSNVPDILD